MKYAATVALFLVLVTGLMIILSPHSSLAQEEKIDLSLSLVSERYYNKVIAGKDTTFFLEVRNTGNKTITNIRLSSIEPEGWTIGFKPGTIDSLSPENFQTLELNIKPGDKAAEGNHKVSLIADASGIRKVLDIWLTVEGEKIDLSLSLLDERYYNSSYNKVTAGKDATFFLEVRNTGNKAITNIRLSSIEPEGWVVDFKPSTIDSLSPNSFQTLELNIKPGDKAEEKNYKVTLIANASGIRRELGIWLTVAAPEGYWRWVGGIIVLLVVAGFIIVYRRFARQ